jgi:hypothetical protein
VDVARLAQFHGIPFVPPRPDPIVQDIATRRIADEQPYIFRLTRMGQAASRRGKSLAFADEVSRLIWGGTQGWHEGDHLAAPPPAPGWTLRNSKPKPPATRIGSMPNSPLTRKRWKPPATGACPRWSLTANRSSGRTASTLRYGAWNRRG